MSSKVYSAALIGLDTQIIEVEVDIRKGKNQINIVGLPDKAISEAKERIIPAIRNSLCLMPKGTITVNLAPAYIPKTGSIYDVPIAIGILIASHQLKLDPKEKIFIGELSLDGTSRDAHGILAIIDGAKREGYKEFFVPADNINEACLAQETDCFPVKNINELIEHFNDKKRIEKGRIGMPAIVNEELYTYDLKHIKGQEHAKRAIEIAAAGGHNCLFTGVPGSGKTYIARCLPGILPDLAYDEQIEVTRIYSVAGLLPKEKPLITARPFRSPHHTTSQVALVGGGSYPKPGEITLAHRGVLFLDEFPEFSSKSLEALRQPLEDRIVNISRANRSLTFPANFMLIAAMNPCKCGYRGDPDKECTCTAAEYIKYQRRISGPVIDRIDLQLRIPKVKADKLLSNQMNEESRAVKERVQRTRDIQLERFKIEKGIFSNCDMGQQQIKKYIQLNKASLEILKTAIDSLNLTARSYFRILKVSRTIADMEESEVIRKEHVAEALSYRL